MQIKSYFVYAFYIILPNKLKYKMWLLFGYF